MGFPEDLVQVDIEAVEERSLWAQVLDDQGGTGVVDVGGEAVAALPRLGRVTERQDLGGKVGLAVLRQTEHLGQLRTVKKNSKSVKQI